MVGEFGTRLTDARDLEMMPQYANYMAGGENGADGLHDPITSWFWWCWNANSGDTGGVVRPPPPFPPPLHIPSSACHTSWYRRYDRRLT